MMGTMMGDSGRAVPLEAFASASRFATEAFRRWHVEPGWLESGGDADDPELPAEARVRRLRQLEGLRIQWRECAGRHGVEETGRRLSALAARCIGLALAAAEEAVAERHGVLRGADGEPVRLAVLALGKLGGDELNFNSDLDLVFGHDASGTSDGRRPLEAREYFGRVVREFTQLMEAVTSHGRAWVIDTRLRPFGQAGALVWSLDAMEQYFISEGRTWERYAWLKARAVGGDVEAGRRLLARIEPFVFRRYLDYGLFDSLRALHADIDRKSQREDLADDIKRGAGGIRELEFLVQSLQLLRGGREPALRRPGFLPALRAARRSRLLDAREARRIDRCYRFLRALENRIQLATGRQTHELPTLPALRDNLAVLAAAESWDALADEVETVRGEVRDLFQARFEPPDERGRRAAALWPPGDDVDRPMRALGFEHADSAAALLRRLAEHVGRRPLSAEARRRLDRVMPELLDEVVTHRPPDTGFEDLLALIETIAQRSAYLALLHERPQTLERCVRVFRESSRVAGWVTASPQLLDDLLAPDQDPQLPLAPTLQPDDIEASLNALARFRQAGFVRTALAQLDGVIDRAGARARLTELAEIVLTEMTELFAPGDRPFPSIIGYGNLGAAELHYTSDLDLVFLHSGDEVPLRAVQRLINAMQLPMAGGKLYEIDTRLRPNGNAGMLVSSLDSFADYQKRHAWTWEHQALIRARCVVGPDSFRDRFEAIRAEVLSRPREQADVARTLADMRRRQLAQRSESAEKRILGDIQFIAEFGVLMAAAGNAGVVEARATIGQLERLAGCGWLSDATAERLTAIFNEAADLRDRLYLERECSESLPPGARDTVDEIWREFFD